MGPEKKLGGGLLDETLRFVMGRLPLANTAESLSLARDLVELLSDRMRMAKKTAQVESALLSAEDEARSSPHMGAASLQLSLFDNGSETASAAADDGFDSPAEDLAPAAEYAVLRRLLDPTGGSQRPAVRPKGRHRLTRRHRPAMLKQGSKSSSRPSRQSPKRNLIRRRLRRAMPKPSRETANRLF